jgi:hypothetical protein
LKKRLLEAQIIAEDFTAELVSYGPGKFVPKDKVCLSAVPKFAAAMSKLTGKSVATIQANT